MSGFEPGGSGDFVDFDSDGAPDVDARLIRVASAGIDPRFETGLALALCGQPPGERCALAAPGRLDQLTTLLHGEAGKPLVVVVHEDDGERESEVSLARVLGRSLGPQVRLARVLVDAPRHLRTDGTHLPSPADPDTLTVLHVRDRAAFLYSLKKECLAIL